MCRMATETPVEAFQRIRAERREPYSALGPLLGINANSVSLSMRLRNRVPERWLDRLPIEYVAPVITAIVAQHHEEIERLWGIVEARKRVSGS